MNDTFKKVYNKEFKKVYNKEFKKFIIKNIYHMNVTVLLQNQEHI
jgi:hypothetical protein